MRTVNALAIFIALTPAGVVAQSPFQFREADLLEGRIRAGRIATDDVSLGRQGPSATIALANPFVAQPDDESIYSGDRWLEVLNDAETTRRRGGFESAERKYLNILEMLRKVRGPESSEVALMLDSLGEFFLEARDFDRAHEKLSESVLVRRNQVNIIDRQSPGTVSQDNQRAALRTIARLHVADMLSRLGEIDLAKRDFVAANRELSEAVAIGNEDGYRNYVSGLYAIYFQSLLFEKQEKWREAEELWKQAVSLREDTNASHWEAMKEMAAFYARRGDFRVAADIVRQVTAGAAGKKLDPQLPLRHAINVVAPLTFALDPRSMQRRGRYTVESDIAMSEILAIDKWRTDGPDAAAPILRDPFAGTFDRIGLPNTLDLDDGPDSERAQLLAWFEKRVFLHMSILLDGDPSQARVQQAYELLGIVKGRYLMPRHSESALLLEMARLNPGAQDSRIHLLDQRTEASASHAHMFIASALDGNELGGLQFAADENTERFISEEIDASRKSVFYSSFAHPGAAGLVNVLPADAAFVDIVVWERRDRAGNSPARREYGAFVTRKGQPVRYVRIGAAESVDGDIDELNAGIHGNRLRGAQVIVPTGLGGPDRVQQLLKSLYGKVVAPMEGLLAGATKVFIVPDGKLTLAPIGGFLDGQGHYFLDRHTISYLGSWRDLVDPRHSDTFGTPSPPLIVANPDFDMILPDSTSAASDTQHPHFSPLPGAELEAQDVAKVLNLSPDRVLIGKMAREELIRSIAGPEILHFATHSIPDLEFNLSERVYEFFEFPPFLAAENPLLQSVIALAGANLPATGREDGLLTGLEIASLRLGATRLVVLSSCESGKGMQVDGQGVLGLRAAFSMAGAQAVVMTLWPVDDQAGRQFVQFFYSHLANDPAEALRLAQFDMRATTQYKDPFYWAGYVASGAPPAQQPKKTAVVGAGESFVAPNCFEAIVNPGPASGHVFRVRIGGVVRASQVSAGKVVYDISGPGTDLEEYIEDPHMVGPPQIASSSLRDWWVKLTIERQNDYSAFSVQTGAPPRQPGGPLQILTTITLKGAPALFPTFEVPVTLPPLTSYTSATVSITEGRPPAQIGAIAACRVGISH